MACHKALSVVACSFEFTNVADEDLSSPVTLLSKDSFLQSLLSFTKVNIYNTKGLLDFVSLQGNKTFYSLKQVKAFLQPFNCLTSSLFPLMVSLQRTIC